MVWRVWTLRRIQLWRDKGASAEIGKGRGLVVKNGLKKEKGVHSELEYIH